MSSITRGYKVEYMEVVPPTDITDKIVSLDDVDFESSGVLSTAKFTLNAENGDFLTNANGGATPLLKQFERIRITIIDDNDVEKDSKIFEITTDLSQLTRITQYFLPIELEGRERNLKGVPFSGFFRDPPKNFQDIINIIVNAYDAGSNFPTQPVLTTFIGPAPQNAAPEINPNIWDFTNVDNCYDALVQVQEVMNLPVLAGGAGNRFALRFIDDPLNLDSFVLSVTIQGSNNFVSIPDLVQNVANPIIKIDEVKQPSTGTQVIVRGRAKTGTLYNEYDKFVSLLEFYKAIPFYDATVVYPTDTFVRQGVDRFRSILEVPISTPPPNVTFWVQIDVGDYIGLIDYSPTTKNKLNEFLNGLGNPEGPFNITDYTAVGIPDSNMVIRDKSSADPTSGTNREEVLFRSNTTVIVDVNLLKYLPVGNFLEGTQVLVDTTLGAVAGDFASPDPNGRTFADSIARIINGVWFVIRNASEFDQCAVYSERKNYEFSVAPVPLTDNRVYPGQDRRRGGTPGSPVWRDISDKFLGNDCFHSPISITQVDGLFADEIENDEPLNDPVGNPYIQNSAIRIEFGYNALNLTGPFERTWKTVFNILLSLGGITTYLLGLAAAVFGRFVNPDYTSLGWWYARTFPIALSTHNSVTAIGRIYGGVSTTDLQLHRYFDTFNSTRTVTGKVGYNQDDSDKLQEVTGKRYLMNFDITTAGIRVPFTGNIPFVYWAIDKEGVTWKSPKKFIRKLGETDTLIFEFGDMTPAYYPRTPLGIDNIIENILVPELEKNKVLFKENILHDGLQCELGYDDQGRYSPQLMETVIKPVFFNFWGGGTDDIRFIGIIDAENWIKTPIAVSKFDTSPSKRIITPEIKDYPNIVNIEQLIRTADALEQVEAFPFEQYTVEQGGIADLVLEDSVYLIDSNYISEADKPATPNSRLLAVRGIHYSSPKNKGLIRKLVLVKKIE